MNAKNCPKQELLADYCLGKLPVVEMDILEQHLKACPTCQDTIHHLDGHSDTFVQGLQAPAGSSPPEAGLQAALSGALKLPLPPAENNVAPAKPAASAAARWVDGQATVTVDDFLHCLAASGVGDPGATEQLIQSLPQGERPVDAKSCAAFLVQRKLLTPYQARAIYQGKPTGLVIADREILDLLGKGGMGNVYKARHRRLDRIEAIKIIVPAKLDSDDARLRFEREARAAARINHPNVVATYDAGQVHGIHFLAMEYVDGVDLARTVKQHGPMTVEQAVACILQAAAGLEAAHAKGIVHRDIKPHNLLLDFDGQVKVLDLGLARLTDANEALQAQRGLTQSGQVMGTVDYMSPEQSLDTHTVGPAGDVYSLGCTLHFLLTGHPPYQAESVAAKILAHHQNPIPSLCAARTDVPPELDAVFQHMLAKQAEDRLATMTDVIAALQSLGSAEKPISVPQRQPQAEVSQIDAFLSAVAKSQEFPKPGGLAPSLAPTQGLRPQPRKKQAFPVWLAATAAAVVGLVLLAAVLVFNLRTPRGELQVVLEEGVADDVSLTVSKGGEQVELVNRADGWKVSLKDGQYDVQLEPGSAERFVLDKQSVTISHKGVEQVRVSLKAIAKKPEPDKVFGGVTASGPAVSTVSAVPSAPLSANVWHEMLPYVDPAIDGARGSWQKTTKGLLGSGSNAALVIPAEIASNAAYETRIRFSFPKRAHEFAVVCPAGTASRVKVVLNHRETQMSGLSHVNNSPPGRSGNETGVPSPPMPPGVKQELLISLSQTPDKATVATQLNGQKLFDWTGPCGALSVHPSGVFGPERCLGVHIEVVDDAEVVIESFAIRSAAPLKFLPRFSSSSEFAAAEYFQKLGGKPTILLPSGEILYNPQPLPKNEPFQVLYLDIGGTQVTDDDMRHLVSLPNLAVLHLWTTKVTDEGFKHVGQVHSLRHIHSCPPDISNAGVRALKPLAGQLETLGLNWVEQVSGEGVAALGPLPSLRTITLTKTRCDLVLIGALRESPRLAEIELDQCTLTAAMVDVLIKFSKLRKLNLYDAKITAADLERRQVPNPNATASRDR